MWNQKGLSSPLPVVLVAFAFAACLALYLIANPFDAPQGSSSSLFRTNEALGSKDIDKEELLRDLNSVLNRASTGDKTVIITTINDAWAEPNSLLDLFFESFHGGENTRDLPNHLVIVAVDQKAYDRCLSVHPHCFLLTTEGMDFAEEKVFMTKDYLELMWRRIDFLRDVLELGFNFIFTDTDVMWFRDPFSYLANSTADLTIACDHYFGDPTDLGNGVNGGFNYVRSNNITVEFYKYWYRTRELYPENHDQDVFNRIKGDEFVTQLGIKFRFLDTALFGGFCEPSKDLNKVYTMHANCCIGLENKLHDLRVVLEDWHNFTALPTEARKVWNSSWRIPIKC